MFRTVNYDFTCLKCGKPNNGSQMVAGQSREEAQSNVLTKPGLSCSQCGEALSDKDAVHFSRNDEVSHVRNKV